MTHQDVENILRELDENLVVINECVSGSTYYRCGSLKVRVSRHFKKDLSESSSAHVTVTLSAFDGPAIILLDKSLFPVVTDYPDELKKFLKYEKFRRDTFFPCQKESPEPAAPEPAENPSEDTPWSAEWPLGPESAKRLNTADMAFRERYKDVANVGEHMRSLLRKPDGCTHSGNMISVAYKEAGLKYTTNKYKEYKDFAGSYRELVYSLAYPEDYAKLKID